MPVDRVNDGGANPATIPSYSGGVSRSGGEVVGPTSGLNRVEAPSAPGGPAAVSARLTRTDPDYGIDPVTEIAELAEGTPAVGPASGLAAQMLDFVMPRPRAGMALTQPRIIPLLGVAADHLGQIAGQSDDVAALGISALEAELRNHSDLAERRSNRIES